MNDLEERIRASLDQRATASAIRTMPPGTRGRIRSRQAGSALVAFATAMAFSFFTFQLFSAPSAPRVRRTVRVRPRSRSSSHQAVWMRRWICTTSIRRHPESGLMSPEATCAVRTSITQ